MNRVARHATFLATVAAVATAATGAINENQVLVIYNSQNQNSQDVYDHYVDTHPDVLGLDLDTTFSSSHTISYSEYENLIRQPIRDYLNANSLQHQVTVFTLTKGIPHRINDTDNPGIGDNPAGAGAETDAGDATFATVDSELPLLWRSLGSNEAGGDMDSFSDNFVLNPYHAQTQSISTFSRSNIVTSKTFQDLGGIWRMREGLSGTNPTDGGDIYLTARLDGNTVQNVKDMIDRAQRLVYNRAGSKIILDEHDANLVSGREFDDLALANPPENDPSYQGPDYEDTFSLMSPTWSNITFNQNGQFLTGESAPGSVNFNDPNRVTTDEMIAALISQGGNHSQTFNQSGYLDTFANQLAAGAIMNTIESYNGKDFGGAGGFGDQGQLSKWIALGGTFGLGHAWEPFAQAVGDSEFLLDNFLNQRLTWAEAAWSSIPYLSWQNLVIGDPLAVVTQPGDADFDGDVDLDDLEILAAAYGTVSGATWEDGNFDFDGDVDLGDLATLAYFYGGGQAQALADFQSLASVPEPALIGSFGATALLTMRQRRGRGGR